MVMINNSNDISKLNGNFKMVQSENGEKKYTISKMNLV